MQTINLLTLNTIASLKELLDTAKAIKLYGAGYYLDIFLLEIEKMNMQYWEKITCIMVSAMEGNPARIKGIPVIAYREACITQGDIVFLTLGHRYTEDVCNLLIDTGANIVQLDFNMFQEKPYQDVKESIQPFIDDYPKNISGLNEPVCVSKVVAWTCWWQGEAQMPDIVKACIRSQKRNLPSEVEHIVITKENYDKYVVLPKYILEKMEKGDIALVQFADILRAALLYKYGGFWMDATLFVSKSVDEGIMDFSIYTRNLPETQYCANAMWATWFWYAKTGNKLFQFLMESFFYYFSIYDRIQYYFTIDYIIAVACNTFPEVEKQMKEIPYNNEKAQELVKHLKEPFDRRKIVGYVQDAVIQKLTYKLDWIETNERRNTIYEYLVNCFEN